MTELVTNSLRHARLRPGDAIELACEMGPQVVRVEVRDPGESFDAPTAAREPESE